ncbi:hypothetical protein IT568_09115 [bacterium]|nr:hypothetical protein [bacterium]
MQKLKNLSSQEKIFLGFVLSIFLPLVVLFYLASADEKNLIQNTHNRSLKMLKSYQTADVVFSEWILGLQTFEKALHNELFGLAKAFANKDNKMSREIYPSIKIKTLQTQERLKPVFVNLAYFDKNGYVLNLQSDEISGLKLITPDYKALQSVKLFDNLVDCLWDSEFVKIDGEFKPFESLGFESLVKINRTKLSNTWSSGEFYRYNAMELYHKINTLRIGIKVFDDEKNFKGLLIGDVEQNLYNKVFNEISEEGIFEVSFIGQSIFKYEKANRFPFTYVSNENSGYTLRLKMNNKSLFVYGFLKDGVILTVFLTFTSLIFFFVCYSQFRKVRFFSNHIFESSRNIVEKDGKHEDEIKKIHLYSYKILELFMRKEASTKVKEALEIKDFE